MAPSEDLDKVNEKKGSESGAHARPNIDDLKAKFLSSSKRKRVL